MESLLNRYRLLETKGVGGFGTVDVAWDNRLQRRVAIKRIPLSNTLSNNQTTIPGIQEARTAALLNESHIVNLLDFQVTSTEALLIMENVDGPTLSDLLEESTELLDLDTIAVIVADVAAALEYAHENQVLHLDIKPDNILIDHKGTVKVTDFGLSELSGTVGFSEPQGGTIGYMPPEQIEQLDIDDRTDMWALAMLLYLMLTGTNPFQAKTSAESLRLIVETELTLPSEIHNELDPDADAIIVQALMADKEQRFADVRSFLDAVTPYLGSVQTGRRNLKFVVNNRDLDEVEFDDDWHQGQLDVMEYENHPQEAQPSTTWERLPNRLRGFLARLVAAIACASCAALGASGFDPLLQQMQPMVLMQVELQPPIVIGALALIAIAAFFVPQLGSALACSALVAGTFARGLFFMGASLAILLVVWWALIGRRSALESTLVMLTPLFGFALLSFALPLLSGYFLSWKRTLISAATQGLMLVATAAMTTAISLAHTGFVLPSVEEVNLTEQMNNFVFSPEPWICLIALLLAALVVTLFMELPTRGRKILGLLLALCIILLAFILMPLVLGIDILFSDLVDVVVGMILSFILLMIMLLLGIDVDTQPTDADSQ